jgi:prophage regulatory protein
MADRILRLPAVMERTGLSKTTIYDHVRLGTFPAPRKIGPRISAWREDEITTWMENLPEKPHVPLEPKRDGTRSGTRPS